MEPKSTPAGRVNCLVADDHPAMRRAVTEILAAHDIDVIGEAADGEEALAKIEARKPDVALVDIRMPRLSGVEVARRASRSSPSTAVILYSGYGDKALLIEALDAGARGFVLKEAPLVDLHRAIEVVARGDTYVDPVLAGALASSEVTAQLPLLTQRERDVLRLLADGSSNEEIGKALFISAETVRTHVRKAMAKLEAETRTEAVAKALRRKLIA
ncbi:MAG TPA: response regulator transcription factor [Gaiellaceae bacterium]|jgi:DNA-binding NarL/FixJ family response regulator|nr:response regulator transcription factor [Gaiellaceae bacterium]